MKLRKNKRQLAATGIAIVGAIVGVLAPTHASATILSAASGVGTFTINYDRAALAALWGGNSTTPGMYNAHFYNTAESDYTSVDMTSMVNGGGMAEQSGPLVHDIMQTGANPSGQAAKRHVKATSADFAIDSADLSGTGILGMTGVQKLAYGFGAYAGYRMVLGDYSLTYAAAQRGTGNNLSGWRLDNNISYTVDAYDLANLSVAVIDANNWKLSGDLMLSAANHGMMGGVTGTRMGGFCLGVGSESGCAAVSAVPVPGAVWLFGSGLAGLTAFGRRRVKAWA